MLLRRGRVAHPERLQLACWQAAEATLPKQQG